MSNVEEVIIFCHKHKDLPVKEIAIFIGNQDLDFIVNTINKGMHNQYEGHYSDEDDKYILSHLNEPEEVAVYLGRTINAIKLRIAKLLPKEERPRLRKTNIVIEEVIDDNSNLGRFMKQITERHEIDKTNVELLVNIFGVLTEIKQSFNMQKGTIDALSRNIKELNSILLK